MQIAIAIAMMVMAVLAIALMVSWIVLPFTLVRKINELIREAQYSNALVGQIRIPLIEPGDLLETPSIPPDAPPRIS